MSASEVIDIGQKVCFNYKNFPKGFGAALPVEVIYEEGEAYNLDPLGYTVQLNDGNADTIVPEHKVISGRDVLIFIYEVPEGILIKTNVNYVAKLRNVTKHLKYFINIDLIISVL